MRRSLPPVLVTAVCILVAVPHALAQVDAPTPIDEVDPGAKPGPGDDEPPADEPHERDPLLDLPVARPKTNTGSSPVLPSTSSPTQANPPDRATAVVPASAKLDHPKAEEKKPAVPADGPAAAAAPAPAETLQPIVLPAVSSAQLATLFAEWRKAMADLQRTASEQKQKALLAAKDELAASDLEAFSVATARAAQKRLEMNDPVGAIELANAAVELAPGLPYAHFALARISFASDVADVARWSTELKATFALLWSDPRYLRPAVGDVAFALLAALLATAVAVMALLFLRRSRYFLHDFHHLFPRAAARWQTVPLAVLLLALPVVFRLGVVPILLAAFASLTLYLEWRERFVAAALIALLGGVPLAGRAITDATAFSGTIAEQLYRLERGGTEADDAAEAVRARMERGSATFPELFALGRYELRRGHLDQAGEVFKKAALENGNDARLRVNLGNVRFGLGDLDGASVLYTRASEADPNLAAAYYNLSQVHYRRAAALTDAAQAQELEKAQTAHTTAQQLDPALLSRAEPPKDRPQPFNRLLLSPGLRWEEMKPFAVLPDAGERVANQLEWMLMGMAASPWAYLVPGLVAFALVGLGALRATVSASRGCEKCGRAVCRRCDPELGVGSGLCGQCVNVFARKGLVAPQVKVRKQLEVDRFQARKERLSWIFGFLCAGGGHVYSGSPLRGALFAFAFLFLVLVGVFREGVLRAPYGELPLLLRLLPAGVVLLVVYLLSLRSLRKVQTR